MTKAFIYAKNNFNTTTLTDVTLVREFTTSNPIQIQLADQSLLNEMRQGQSTFLTFFLGETKHVLRVFYNNGALVVYRYDVPENLHNVVLPKGTRVAMRNVGSFFNEAFKNIDNFGNARILGLEGNNIRLLIEGGQIFIDGTLKNEETKILSISQTGLPKYLIYTKSSGFIFVQNLPTDSGYILIGQLINSDNYIDLRSAIKKQVFLPFSNTSMIPDRYIPQGRTAYTGNTTINLNINEAVTFFNTYYLSHNGQGRSYIVNIVIPEGTTHKTFSVYYNTFVQFFFTGNLTNTILPDIWFYNFSAFTPYLYVSENYFATAGGGLRGGGLYADAANTHYVRGSWIGARIVAGFESANVEVNSLIMAQHRYEYIVSFFSDKNVVGWNPYCSYLLRYNTLVDGGASGNVIFYNSGTLVREWHVVFGLTQSAWENYIHHDLRLGVGHAYMGSGGAQVAVVKNGILYPL